MTKNTHTEDLLVPNGLPRRRRRRPVPSSTNPSNFPPGSIRVQDSQIKDA